MTLLVLSLLWVISGVLFFIQVKEKYNYWYAGFIFSVALGILCDIFIKNIIPNATNPELLHLIARLLSALSYRLSPYFHLLVGVSVSGIFSKEVKKNIYRLALAPVIISFITDFIFPETGFLKVFLDYSPVFWILVLWAVAYTITSSVIMLYSYLKETNFNQKRQKLFVCIITLPALYAAVTSYIYPLFLDVHKAAEYNIIPALIVFGSFIFFSIRFGFLGLKITFENQRINDTVKAVSSSTSFINHAVKNELLKIKWISKNLKDQQTNESNLELIDTSIEHMMSMFSRIQEKTQAVILKEQLDSLNEIIHRALLSSSPGLTQKNILVDLYLHDEVILACDPVHIQEVICNIIMNAADAIQDQGRISVEFFRTNKYFILEIKDNGCGIPKENLHHVVEPFFTTKNKQTNFGLGLTYCYNIMTGHGGVLEVQSEENKGTSIALKFPMKKIKEIRPTRTMLWAQGSIPKNRGEQANGIY